MMIVLSSGDNFSTLSPSRAMRRCPFASLHLKSLKRQSPVPRFLHHVLFSIASLVFSSRRGSWCVDAFGGCCVLSLWSRISLRTRMSTSQRHFSALFSQRTALGGNDQSRRGDGTRRFWGRPIFHPHMVAIAETKELTVTRYYRKQTTTSLSTNKQFNISFLACDTTSDHDE